ncbi:radical SAM protein [Brachyspira hampsonii 30599]|nr:radical SAM protein [Brachyspira hampsonii 30599]
MNIYMDVGTVSYVQKNKSNKNNYNLDYFLVSSFINQCNHFKNIYAKMVELENKIKDNNKNLNIIHNVVNTLAWWIPVKKWRDNFRNKFNTDQTRPDQTRPDQTRPEIICKRNIYVFFNNIIIINKLQPMLQYYIAA